jgi:hypothetical protein
VVEANKKTAPVRRAPRDKKGGGESGGGDGLPARRKARGRKKVPQRR